MACRVTGATSACTWNGNHAAWLWLGRRPLWEPSRLRPSSRQVPVFAGRIISFEPAASSSGSQVAARAASAAARMAWGTPSVHVRWRPPLSVAIVTQFVTRSLASRWWSTAVPHTLSASARLSPAKVNTVRDLGCPSSVVRTERLWLRSGQMRCERW